MWWWRDVKGCGCGVLEEMLLLLSVSPVFGAKLFYSHHEFRLELICVCANCQVVVIS